MSFIKAKNHLEKYNLENKIMEFDVSSATVKEAAQALNCSEGEIAKTMEATSTTCFQKQMIQTKHYMEKI